MSTEKLVEAFASIPALSKVGASFLKVAIDPPKQDLRGAIYLSLLVTDREIQKELVPQLMCVDIPRQFNEKFGAQLNDGHISTGSPTCVTLYYSYSSLGNYSGESNENLS
jgi:hypothetical protein